MRRLCGLRCEALSLGLGLLLCHRLLPQFLDELWDRHSCLLCVDGELSSDGLDLLGGWLLAGLQCEPWRARGLLGLLGRVGHGGGDLEM